MNWLVSCSCKTALWRNIYDRIHTCSLFLFFQVSINDASLNHNLKLLKNSYELLAVLCSFQSTFTESKTAIMWRFRQFKRDFQPLFSWNLVRFQIAVDNKTVLLSWPIYEVKAILSVALFNWQFWILQLLCKMDQIHE